MDLLGFDDDDAFASAPAAPPAGFGTNKALPAVSTAPAPAVSLDDDDFGNFEAAPVSPVAAAAPQQKVSLMDMLGSPAAPQPSAPPLGMASPTGMMSPAYGMQAQAHAFGAFGAAPVQPQGMGMGMHRQTSSVSMGMGSPAARVGTPTMTPTASARPPVGASKPSAGGFDDLFSMALGSGMGSKPGTPVGGAKSMQEIQKEKAQAGIWGAGKAGPAGMGGFGGSSTSTMGGGGDDLLL